MAKGTTDPGVDNFDQQFWFGRFGLVCLVWSIINVLVLFAVCPKSFDSQCFRILLLSVDVGPGRAAIYQGFSHGKDFAGTLR